MRRLEFALPPELNALREVVREFVERRCRPHERRIEEEDRIPADLLQAAADLGLFGLAVPEAYGGLGLGVLGRAVVNEELGRTHAGLASVIGAHTGIGTTGIVQLGTEEQKQRYLPDLACGRRLAAFALTEPEAGSDAAAIRTRAERRNGEWVLNGQKCFITNGPEAEVFTVIAVTDPSAGRRGISAFIVERGFPGFRVGRVDVAMGLRGSHVAELLFEDCHVPAENLLGAEGQGYVSALNILTTGRATLAARCVGAAQRILEVSVAHARTRRTFGKPLAEHQLIQAYIAEMATDVTAARLLAYRAAWRADQGHPAVQEAAMAKLFASEALGRVADLGVQIHGGIGYIRGSEVERYYRDSRITRIYEGTSEIQKLIIAARVLQELG